MEFLITGGAGFTGSHLADKLISKGYNVVSIDNLSTGNRKNLNSKAKFYKLDIQSSKISEIFKKEKPEILFHFAAQIDVRKSVESPVDDAKINILGSLNLLENCRKHAIKRVVFASTGGVMYGEADVIPTPETYPANPISPYGVVKLSIEKYLHYYNIVHKISYIVLRFGNVYGPRQNPLSEAGIISIFINQLLSGKSPIIYGTGKQTRDFIFIDDVIEAILKTVSEKIVGIFNIGTGKQTSVEYIFKEIKRIIGSNIKAKKMSAQSGEHQIGALSYLKAKKELRWSPQWNINEGLKETIKYSNIETKV